MVVGLTPVAVGLFIKHQHGVFDLQNENRVNQRITLEQTLG